MNSPLATDVQQACATTGVPASHRFADWAGAVTCPTPGRVCIRIVDRAEMTDLNQRYRNRAGATDVLAFPADADARAQGHLGDVAICAPVVLAQAAEHAMPSEERFAQITVHGLLHLLGHDHQGDAERSRMEALETQTLARLGFTDPYCD